MGYAKPDVLVETAWVADHLKDPTVRIVEVDVDTTAYAQGHVPGAIGFDWKSDIQNPLRRDFVDRAAFEALASRAGIANDHTVVFYGDNNNWFATWAYWLFKYYGHRDTRVMNGGRKKWIDEGRPLDTAASSYPKTTYRAQEPDQAIRAFRQQVLERLGQPGVGLVDVRSPKEFTGELLAPENLPQEGAQRGGHIPGAANVPWATAVREDGTFKSAEELRAIYEPKGITADKEIVAYCRIGERSSHTWFVLRELLGYPRVRNYDGSWTEWGSLVDVPIER
ncbi:MAG: sulfurtransferase [Armatimonadota bacterium]|nr:sulfurtransferase [Armatimonadota bacterium]MDR7422717.1 sulfurtransferase [Armatimonadota bacterium]MDR7454031.1 sulfurtransferase [Armatimonadota bacterium]MDR7457427.1 sulfurtransferase [Armatimonadota bacterium]MDR7497609.1 sulfurtransferase [Armatimonadota bacterium]